MSDIDIESIKARLDRNAEFLRIAGRMPLEEWHIHAAINDQFVNDFIEDGRKWLDAAFEEIERLQSELDKFKECFEHPKETCRGFTVAECLHIYHKVTNE